MRKKSLKLTAVIYPDADSDWLVAHNPETGTTTQGKTLAAAKKNLWEAVELYLETWGASGPKDAGKICTGSDLAEALRGVKISPLEVQAWRKDLLKARKSLKAPAGKWG